MMTSDEYIFISRIPPSGAWGAQRISGDEPEEWFTLAGNGTLEQAINRAREKWPGVELHIEDVCECCGGSGADEDWISPEPCMECDGDGVVTNVISQT